MNKTEQKRHISVFLKICEGMKDDDLNYFRMFSLHDCWSSEDKDINIYNRIIADCTCFESHKRGLYKYDGLLDNGIWDRVMGDSDYNEL